MLVNTQPETVINLLITNLIINYSVIKFKLKNKWFNYTNCLRLLLTIKY